MRTRAEAARRSRGNQRPRRAARAFAALTALTALAALGAVMISTPAVAAGPEIDFPAYMHDAGHSGYSPDATAIAPTTPLHLAYTFKTVRGTGQPARGFVATPIVVDHVIYVGANTGEFYAIDEATGTILWEDFLGFEPKAGCGYSRGFAATAASGIDPTSGNLTIYAASGDGNVYALNAADGTVVWKSPVNVPTPGMNDYYSWSSPEIANGKIYVGVASFCDNPFVRGGVVSLDQATGNQLAVFHTVGKGQVGASVWSSPAIAPDGSLVITTGNSLGGATIGHAQSILRLDPNTLQRLDSWRLVTKGGDSDFGASPTIFSASIDGVQTPMVGDCDKNGIYYAWKLDDLHAGPVWKDTVGITGHRSGGEVCLAGAVWDGSNLYVGGTASTIDGVFYHGSIRKLDPATGAPVWVSGLPAAVMTSASMDGAGALVVTSYDRDLSVTNSAFLVDAATGAFSVIDDGGSRAAPSGVFADDYMLIATNAGKIYAYEASPPP